MASSNKKKSEDEAAFAMRELARTHTMKEAGKASPWPIDVVMVWCGLPDMPWCRYTDDLRFSLRAVCENLPWFRNVIIVVQDDFELPFWMRGLPVDESARKRLKFVKLSSFIPRRYIPNYNWHVIQSWLWKIRVLSKHFVFLHDDMYVMRPTPWWCFFTRDGRPINRHYAGGADHGIHIDHRIPYVRMWNNAILKHNIHNTRVQQEALPYRKDMLKALFERFKEYVELGSRERFVAGERDFDLLRFATAVTSTEGKAVLLRTNEYEWQNDNKARLGGWIDYFVESEDVKGIRNILKIKPRFFCINNSAMIYTHMYDTLREIFPKKSFFEPKTDISKST